MTSTTTSLTPKERLDVLFEELAELTGQRNAIDGRVVQIVAEIDHDGLWGATGARSIAGLVAWKTGASSTTANTIATVAHRLAEFPRCAQALREGRLSLDQVGVIAAHAADGSDEHYAQLAAIATVNQLRTAIKLEPRPEPQSDPDTESDSRADAESGVEPEADVGFVPQQMPMSEPPRSITRTDGELSTTYRIVLPHAEAAVFDAALQSHHDALIAQWKREHPANGSDGAGSDGDGETNGHDPGNQVPPFPKPVDGLLSLVEAGWDTDVVRRPQGQRTTVVVHLDIEQRNAALHLGPLLSDEDRRYLLCDATCEAWFERHGRVIGSGRETRTVNRRLRRALEHRDRCCVVPGCGATRGLHAHHIQHWEDGGPTDLTNLVLVCPFHHRLHHRGGITITGDAHHLVVTDTDGRPLTNGSLARPPTQPPPKVPACPGPTGERADWWWYDPFQPQPPPIDN